MRALLSYFRLSPLLSHLPRRTSLHPTHHRLSPINSLFVSRRSFAMAVNNLKPLQSPISDSTVYDVEKDDEFWTFVKPSNSVPGHYVYTKPIHKSEQDDREYRMVRLENGLQALLVHDAKTDKAAASLDVAVGHLSDPVSGSVLCGPDKSVASWKCGLISREVSRSTA